MRREMFGMGVLCAGLVLPIAADEPSDGRAISVYDFEMKDIDGKTVKLSNYEGKVLMIVNVASK